ARDWRYLGEFFVAPGYSTELVRLYEAHGLSPGSPGSLPADEFIESTEVPLAEALAMVRDGRIADAKTIIGLLIASAKRGQA
ncbi:MAG: NUDIX hydrolase, partial [Cyanobacteria bacterium REEB65]|nr:NUDIX hydrolase [Cyanobacteria bacterium REEB65]